MAAKPRKSAVQNLIKNLLEMEIPEIQNASKELADWIKQLEQHSFKLQHYATEIETWASEEEEADSIELTDLIKDLEATLTDMRKGRLPSSSREETDESDETTEKMLRGYGLAGRVIKEPKALPKAEIKGEEKAVTARPQLAAKQVVEEPKKEPARTPQGVLIAKDVEKPRAKAEIPTGAKEVVKREADKATPVEEEDAKGYMTPEGFLIRRLRP
jgi:hypothetical protein